jgi:hypothetical protein
MKMLEALKISEVSIMIDADTTFLGFAYRPYFSDGKEALPDKVVAAWHCDKHLSIGVLWAESYRRVLTIPEFKTNDEFKYMQELDDWTPYLP